MALSTINSPQRVGRLDPNSVAKPLPYRLTTQEILDASPRSRDAIEETLPMWAGRKQPWVHRVCDPMTVAFFTFLLGSALLACTPEFHHLVMVDKLALLIAIGIVSAAFVVGVLMLVGTNKDGGAAWIRFRNTHLRPEAAQRDALRVVREINSLRKSYKKKPVPKSAATQKPVAQRPTAPKTKAAKSTPQKLTAKRKTRARGKDSAFLK